MPVYTVQIRVNVPSVGEKTITVPNITAASIPQAIAIAQGQITIEPVAAQKTGA